MGVAPRLWRVLDAVDYWVMQAGLWRADALYGPEPEIEANRQRACESGALAGLGSPPAAGVVRPVANASPLRFPPPEPQHRNSPAFARVSGPPSRNTIRNSSRNGPEPATPSAVDGAAKGVSDVGNRTGTSEARDAPLVRGADRGSRAG